MAKTFIGPDAYLLSDASENGNSLIVKKNVTVEEAAGATAISVDGLAENVTLHVKGKVLSTDAFTVVMGAVSSTTIIAKGGVIRAEPPAAPLGVHLTAQNNDLINRGTIVGIYGVYDDAGGQEITNYGLIKAVHDTGAAIYSQGVGTTITNFGQIAASQVGIFYEGDNGVVVNHGEVSAQYGIYIIETSTSAENTGSVYGSVHGFYHDDSGGGAFTNSGKVEGGQSAIRADGALVLTNSGVLTGESGKGVVEVEGGSLTMINSGKVKGTLMMTANDDSYTAQGSGKVTGFVEGGDGADALRGGTKGDKLHGGEGDDTVSGKGGKDRVFGGDGSDTLEGGNGNDVLRGGDDTDFLFGDKGNDRLFGGFDGDIFFFSGNRPGHDVIGDFENDRDFIDLSPYALTVDQQAALFDAITIGFDTAVIDLSVIPGVKGSITLEHFTQTLAADHFIFT